VRQAKPTTVIDNPEPRNRGGASLELNFDCAAASAIG
jgi:hypothetical protein